MEVKNPQSHMGGRIFAALSLCIISNGLPEMVTDIIKKIAQIVPHVREIPLKKLFPDELFKAIVSLTLIKTVLADCQHSI